MSLRKEKPYDKVWFPADVVEQALVGWESAFRSESAEPNYSLLSLTQHDETWGHDELERFLRAYNEGVDRALLVARIDGESEFSLSHTPFSCTVLVEGEDREKIESVFAVFERAIENGNFERLESQPPSYGDLVDPDSGAHNQSRRFTIQDKIIGARDLAKLARRLEGSVNRDSADGQRIRFDLEWVNNSSISLGDSESFERELDGADIGLYSVRLSLRDLSLQRGIECQLTHGNSYRDNMLEVSGPDRQWVTDTYSIAERTVHSFRPQNKLLRKTEPLVVAGTFIVCIWGAQKIGYPIVNNFSDLASQPDGSSAIRGVLLALGVLLSFLLGLRLWNLPKTAFPDIELQIGPEHTHREARFRLLVAFVLGALILPIAIEWLF
jgi:hypothetical protein